jgi:DNA-binding SARP family transcriptional activator/tetratricopeptide (TPR) repeat protein
MEFRILGPLEVRVDGTALAVIPPKHRVLLAALLLRANHVAPTGWLIDALWDEAPPRSAATLVRVYVSQLRKLLTWPDRADSTRRALSTRPGGYLLELAPDELDWHRFERLTEQARREISHGALERAAHHLCEGLALWRGPALCDVGSGFLHQVEGRRLEECRLEALEVRIDVDLCLGRDAQLVAELRTLTAEHPLSERFQGQLMLALYRSGRQAEALEVFHAVRRTMVEELGLEPSPELQRLHRAILANEPALAPAGELVRVPGSSLGIAEVPHQLPPAIDDFTGRDEPLARLRSLLERERGAVDTAVPICVISGTAGVGKTALAVHAAQLTRARFPDGQLHASLRGAQARPSNQVDVLAGFLRALGVDGSAIPLSGEDRERLYRTRLADRRVLVLLDDAADEAQVRPLVPAGPGSAVLVTSRSSLTGLEGAHPVTLDMFSQDEALRLLERLIGPDRVAAEPDAAKTIVDRCGRLPLAVRVAGAKLALRGQQRLARLAERLEDEQRRLDELRTGDLEVRASLGLSYQGQGQLGRRAFRLLSLLDVQDFAAWAVAAVLEEDDLAPAEAVLGQLVDAHLVEVAGEDAVGQPRYRLHDLLHVLGREWLHHEEAPPARQAALRRFLASYLTLAEDADAALRPGRSGPGRERPAAGRGVREAAPAGAGDALRWLQTERSGLIASVRQAHAAGEWELTWRLAASLAGFFEQRADWLDWRRCHVLALDAARRAADPRGEGIILLGLGVLDTEQACFGDALDRYRRSLGIFRELGDRWWQAHVLHRLGELNWEQAQLDEAVARLRESVALFGALGDRHGQAVALCGLSLALDHQGRLSEALAGYEACLSIFEELGDRLREAITLQNLGFLHRERGDLEEALECYERCLAMFRELGDRRFEATTLRSLGDVCCEQDRLQAAYGWLHQSLALFRQLGDRRFEALALRTLGDVHRKAGRYAASSACLESSLAISRELGDRRIEGYGLHSLGELLQERGSVDDALAHYRQALTAFRGLGLPLWQGRTLDRIGCALAAQGDEQAARAAWREAAAILERLGTSDAAHVRGRLTAFTFI